MRGRVVGVLVAGLFAGSAMAQDQEGVAKANRNEFVRVTQALQEGSDGNRGLPDAALISKVQGAVADLMKDPTSVQFRAVRVKRVGDIRYVCGELNARNSFGGYVGFKPFLSDGVRTTVLQGGMTPFLADLVILGRMSQREAEAMPNPAMAALCE